MVVSMKIKNKLVLAFVSVAFIPVSLVAVISVMNTRTQAVDQFIDGSTREIRQIDGNIRQFFDGTLQNVDQMATDSVYTSVNTLKNYQPADAAAQPLPAEAQTVIERFARSLEYSDVFVGLTTLRGWWSPAGVPAVASSLPAQALCTRKSDLRIWSLRRRPEPSI